MPPRPGRAAAPKSLKEDSDSEDEVTEQEDQEDDVISDEEEAEADAPGPSRSPAQRKRAKTASGAPARSPKAPPAAAPRRRRVVAAPVSAAALKDLTLFEILCHHPNAAASAAKEWVGRYQRDGSKVEATAELLTLLVQCAGANAVVTSDEVEEGAVDDMAKRLAETITAEGGAQPFHDRRTARALRLSFSAFWDTAVSELHALSQGLADDDYALEHVCSLIIALNCSGVRPFRLAATLAAAQLITTWTSLRQRVGRGLREAQYQRDAEAKKRQPNTALVTQLKRQVDAHQRTASGLASLTDNLFKTVFGVRFRDVCPEIRSVVIRSIGSWIATMPDTFMVDSYLKYLGWALSDRDAGVRRAAVTALLQLYGTADNAPGLRDFKGRFTERFHELVYDVDGEVAAAGIRLLSRLVALGELERSSVRDPLKLLADDNGEVRAAAAELAVQLLQEDAAVKQQEMAAAAAAGANAAAAGKAAGGRSKKGQQQQAAAAGGGGAAAPTDPQKLATAAQLAAVLDLLAWLQIGCAGDAPHSQPNPTAAGTAPSPSRTTLLARTMEPLEPEVVGLITGALYDKLPVLRDAGAMVDSLLDDARMEERGRAGSAHLVMMLAASAQRAQHGAGGQQEGAGPRSKAAAPNAEAHQEVTLSAMRHLTTLIRKYQTEPVVVAPLLGLIRSLRLELFSLRQEERGFGDLLALVSEQLFKHGDARVVREAVASTLHCARAGPGALQPAAQLALGNAVNRAASGLTAAVRALAALPDEDLQGEVDDLDEVLAASASGTVSGAEGAETLFKLHAALLRVGQLLCFGARGLAAPSLGVQDALAALLEGAGSGRLLGGSTTELAVHSALLCLMWGIVRLNSDAGAGSAPGDAAEGGEEEAAGGRGTQAAGTGRVAELSQRANQLATLLQEVYDAAEAAEDVRDVVFRALSDLYLVFGGEVWKGTVAEAAHVEPTDDGMRKVWSQCAAIMSRYADVVGPSGEPVQAEDEEGSHEDEGLSEDEKARKAAARAFVRSERLTAIAGISRLLTAGTLSRHYKWLGINLVSNFAVYGAEVGELVREVCRGIKRVRPALMPDIYLGAMRLAFTAVLSAAEEKQRIEEEGADRMESDHDAMEADLAEAERVHEAALQDFSKLSQVIASMYAGHNINREELLTLVRGGQAYGLGAPPTRLPFLSWGLSYFTSKLPVLDAEELLGELEEAVAASPVLSAYDAEDDSVAGLQHYLRGLKERAANKSRVLQRRGGLKATAKPPAAAAAAADGEAAEGAPAADAAAAARQRRKISFAPEAAAAAATPAPASSKRKRKQRDEEEEEQGEEQAEEGAAAAAGAGAGAQQQAAGWRSVKRGRPSAAAAPLPPPAAASPQARRQPKRRGATAAARVPAQDEDENEQGEELSDGEDVRAAGAAAAQAAATARVTAGMRTRGRQQAPAAAAAAEPAASEGEEPEEAEPQGEEVTEGGDELAGAMATEEQLPLSRPSQREAAAAAAARGKQQPQQRRTSGRARGVDAGSGAGSGSAAGLRRSGRRAAVAAAPPSAPSLAAVSAEEGEEEDEEFEEQGQFEEGQAEGMEGEEEAGEEGAAQEEEGAEEELEGDSGVDVAPRPRRSGRAQALQQQRARQQPARGSGRSSRRGASSGLAALTASSQGTDSRGLTARTDDEEEEDEVDADEAAAAEEQEAAEAEYEQAQEQGHLMAAGMMAAVPTFSQGPAPTQGTQVTEPPARPKRRRRL